VAKTSVHYRYSIPTSITVEIDTREKHPVKFPSTIRTDWQSTQTAV
jgi:hypothetical protein